MDALDGNAIAGELQSLYGVDMTSQFGTCRHCGRRSLLGDLVVYVRAPGSVARCRTCGEVVFVLVAPHGRPEIKVTGFDLPADPVAFEH